MIRIATENDLPEILNVYRPYVEEGTASFEYVTPTAEKDCLRISIVRRISNYMI